MIDVVASSAGIKTHQHRLLHSHSGDDCEHRNSLSILLLVIKHLLEISGNWEYRIWIVLVQDITENAKEHFIHHRVCTAATIFHWLRNVQLFFGDIQKGKTLLISTIKMNLLAFCKHSDSEHIRFLLCHVQSGLGQQINLPTNHIRFSGEWKTTWLHRRYIRLNCYANPVNCIGKL